MIDFIEEGNLVEVIETYDNGDTFKTIGKIGHIIDGDHEGYFSGGFSLFTLEDLIHNNSHYFYYKSPQNMINKFQITSLRVLAKDAKIQWVIN
jgi:hypothetical protein